MASHNTRKPPMARGGMRNFEKAKNFKKSFKNLVKFLRPNYISIIFSLLFAVVGTVFAILSPNIIKLIGEEIFTSVQLGINVDMAKVASIGLWLVLMYVTSTIFSYFQGFLMSGVTARVSKDFRNQISKKINKLPLKYFDKNVTLMLLKRGKVERVVSSHSAYIFKLFPNIL